MNTNLSLQDYAALSPLLILLTGSLLVLLIESFFPKSSPKISFPLTIVTLIIALGSVFYAPTTTHGLLTPWLRFDGLAQFFAIFFIVIGASSAGLAEAFFKRFEASHGEFYFLLLTSTIGLMLIGYSADFLTLFLGLETLSISLYILCGYMKKWELSHESAMKYFFMGSLGAALLLYGIALIYGAAGTTRFSAITPQSSTLFMGGIALVTVGLCFKAAIVPFHVWAPDVYDGAPNPVTAFMAVGTKAGAFAALAVLFLLTFINFNAYWNEALSVLAYLTLIYANYVALRQTQLRRFFAYSGISHAGFLLFPLIASTPDSLNALLFYLVVYAAATLGSFAILAYLDKRSDGVTFNDLKGLFNRSPWLASLFAIFLLTLAGIPPTAGFFAKFYLFKVVFEAGYYGLVIVGLLTTILSAFYYLRIISIMFAEQAHDLAVPAGKPAAGFVGWASLAVIAGISFFPGHLQNMIQKLLG